LGATPLGAAPGAGPLPSEAVSLMWHHSSPQFAGAGGVPDPASSSRPPAGDGREELQRALSRMAGALAAAHARQRIDVLRHVAQLDAHRGTVAVADEAPERREAGVAVHAFVCALRDAGQPPERALVAVKSAVRDAAADVLDPEALHDLTEDVVRWSIAAYYEG
jgi:hypothetical protein